MDDLTKYLAIMFWTIWIRLVIDDNVPNQRKEKPRNDSILLLSSDDENAKDINVKELADDSDSNDDSQDDDDDDDESGDDIEEYVNGDNDLLNEEEDSSGVEIEEEYIEKKDGDLEKVVDVEGAGSEIREAIDGTWYFKLSYYIFLLYVISFALVKDLYLLLFELKVSCQNEDVNVHEWMMGIIFESISDCKYWYL